MQNPLMPILEKEMDRKEFLVHVGAGLMAFLGISTILKALTGAHTEQRSSNTERTSGGYGGGAYGK